MTFAPQLEHELSRVIALHDQQTSGLGIWLGAEPTFTDRFSEAPEWLSDALGDEKESRARKLIARLSERHPGGLVMRPLGRQYPREPLPRFCYGLYEARDGSPIWTGPPDRLLDGPAASENLARAQLFADALCETSPAAGLFCRRVANTDDASPRVLLRFDGKTVTHDAQVDARLARDSIHGVRIEGASLSDELAPEGSYLLLVHAGAGGEAHNELWVELPAFACVADLQRVIHLLAGTCRALELSSFGIRGFSPCVDATVAWTTITPDPAVIEVNQAPFPDVASFHRATLELFELAADVGLCPYRLQYNGTVTDSGGGGQLTFGGPSSEESPFFKTPMLLPRLVRYVVRHPSLSYWFATAYVGGSSQSPRTDEGARETFLELEVALEQLAQEEAPPPNLIWGALRHFLVDASGNPHRSELNIEKLDNPFLPDRGRLGLVELRALAMAPNPSIATARAMLLRGVLAMLTREDRVSALTHWHDTLHDRFALPFFLELDLHQVFLDLTNAGLGLGNDLERALLARSEGTLAEAVFEDCLVRVDQALEFWPLVGDVAAQEAGSSRLVDASTSRLQVTIESLSSDAASLSGIEVRVKGYRLPLRDEVGLRGPARVLGLRYRSFVPWTGLHPSLPAETSVELTVVHPSGRAMRMTLHPWRPDGGAYPGLPASLEEAHARRLSRTVIESLDASCLPRAKTAPSTTLTPYSLDLRRLGAPPPRVVSPQ